MLCSVAVLGVCCRLCLTLTGKKKKKNRHGKKWLDTLRSPPGQLARRERRRRSTYCCCGKPPLLGCCWNICTCWFVSAYIWSQNARRLDDSLLPRRLWRAGQQGPGKRDLRSCFYHPPWQLLGWRLGWKDCCCHWLLLGLLQISRMLCSVAVSGVMLPLCLTFGEGKNRHGKKWPYTLHFPPSQLA